MFAGSIFQPSCLWLTRYASQASRCASSELKDCSSPRVERRGRRIKACCWVYSTMPTGIGSLRLMPTRAVGGIGITSPRQSLVIETNRCCNSVFVVYIDDCRQFEKRGI
jgi:hypothetical protein